MPLVLQLPEEQRQSAQKRHEFKSARQAVQAFEGLATWVGQREARDRCSGLALQATNFRGDDGPEPGRYGEHDSRNRDANGKTSRARTKKSARDQADENDASTAVGDEVKSSEYLAEKRTSLLSARCAGHAKNVKRSRGDNGTESDEAANPYDESQQRRIPQREHPLIIIDRP